MGTLYWQNVNTRVPLRAYSIFGRHPVCHVYVDHPLVSGEHTSLAWNHGVWELRDLGSRNGTYLEGRRLEPGERVVIHRGASFCLSRSTASFLLVDASAPMISATHTQTGKVLIADGEMLVLPDEQHPGAMLMMTSDGSWQIEMDTSTRPVSNQEIITVGNDSFVLEIPEAYAKTAESEAGGALIEAIKIRFAVSLDEEQVNVTVWVGGQPKRLEPREYHYMLATLARIRLADAHLSTGRQGWVDKNDLCKKLNTDRNKLNVEIFRARKQLSFLGIEGATRLVEQRPGTREIRLGVANVEVVRS